MTVKTNFPQWMAPVTNVCPNDAMHTPWVGDIPCPSCHSAVLDKRFNQAPKTKKNYYEHVEYAFDAPYTAKGWEKRKEMDQRAKAKEKAKSKKKTRKPSGFYATCGEEKSQSKLTEANVREIRKAYADGGTSYPELGKKYGVSDKLIGKVVRGERWVHVK